MATIKNDYLDLMIKRVENSLSDHIEALKEMMEAEKAGKESHPKMYIKMVANTVWNYYFLLDDVYNDSRIQGILKKRHKDAKIKIRVLFNEFESLVKENGFKDGMLGATKTY
jgi:hypothetical protein